MNDLCIALVAPNGSEHKLLYDAVCPLAPSRCSPLVPLPDMSPSGTFGAVLAHQHALASGHRAGCTCQIAPIQCARTRHTSLQHAALRTYQTNATCSTVQQLMTLLNSSCKHVRHLQVILVPDLLFLAYLVYTARRCYDILSRSPSMIMWTYYCLVWAVTLCNVLRIIVQLAASSESHSHLALWNVLWLLTRFIMTTLEVRLDVAAAWQHCSCHCNTDEMQKEMRTHQSVAHIHERL